MVRHCAGDGVEEYSAHACTAGKKGRTRIAGMRGCRQLASAKRACDAQIAFRALVGNTFADANGRLFLVALAPGSYDVYRADLTSEMMLAQGYKEGFVTSVTLAPSTPSVAASTCSKPPKAARSRSSRCCSTKP